MQYNITAPEALNQTVKLPASKSISNRALIIYALSGGDILPDNLSDCDDTEVIVSALRDNPHEINIKAAGTAMRFMTAYLATRVGEEHILTGTERMQHRPIRILVDALRLDIAGNISSQYISALLLIGPYLRDGLTLRMTGDVISRPYIDLTLWMMGEFGAEAEWSTFGSISVCNKPYQKRPYFIESDWSAASYWYEMMALSKNPDDEIRLEGLMNASKQGDSSVRYIFSLLGVKSNFGTTEEGVPTTVTLRHSGRCVPRLEYDFVNSPDLAQTFVVCCAMLGVPFHFHGLSTLKIKETDRIEALKTEMRKMGFVLHDVNGSELYWDGERCEPQHEAGIDTYEDHRMALAFAPAAFRTGQLRINNPQVVTKSYPKFWEDIKAAGFEVNSEQ